jgi:RNA polymerase sigma-70 factor, ECF subfamily
MTTTTIVPNDMTLAAVEDAVREAASHLLTESEFRSFYERTARPVWAYLARLTGDRSEADDLLQETYYRFYRASASYENESHRRNALFTIATNLARDAHRRTKAVEVLPLEEDHSVTNSVVHGVEVRADLERALDSVSRKEREMLLLAYGYGSTHEEIASTVGVASSSVKGLLLRARRKVVAALEGKRKVRS